MLKPGTTGSAWRELLQSRDEVARKDALTVALPQHPLRNLPGHGGLPSLDLARRSRDERPYPPLHVDRALSLEGVVGVLNGVGVHLQLTGQLAHGRERVLRLEHSKRHRPLNLVHHLSVDRARVAGVDLEHYHMTTLSH